MGTKLIGKDTSTCQLDTGIDIVAILASWEVSADHELIETTPLTALAKAFREGDYGWKVNLEGVVDTSAAWMLSLVSGGTVQFSVKQSATGTTFAGAARIVSGAVRSGGRQGMQSQTLALQGEGALNITVPTP